MVEVKEIDKKVTTKKKCIAVKNVTIIDNTLVDVETGEKDVLATIADAIPNDIESFSFKITFELPDED